LTEKETAVLKEMATGRNNSSIAQVLFMSERAVEKHVGAIFQKLGLSEERELNRRVAAVITFLEAGGAAPPGRYG
jgi:DNA-binding NarL/FixJ family response regulator